MVLNGDSERTRLHERIVEISGHSSMEGPVSMSESGMFTVTKLTLPASQTGWTDSPDRGRNTYWRNDGNDVQKLAEK